MVRPSFLIGITAGIAAAMPLSASAAPAAITYTYNHHLITVSVAGHPEWRTQQRTWLFHGVPAVPPSRFLTCGALPEHAAGWTTRTTAGWSEEAIARTIQRDVASKIDRPAGSVTISRTGTGTVTFQGQGLTGQSVDIDLAARLTVRALGGDIGFVVLPVGVQQPAIDVRDEGLRSMGIREVVTIGESVFLGSPKNRRHNIGVGVARFSGHVILQGSTFSFDQTLGPVNASTGYRKELVIQGQETLPDYGGGLCQVSSTAYRGPWEYGLPIVQRKNHSYAVTYYSPQGTDATVYPPRVDMKFRNDTPGALLIQSFTDDEDRAFFIYYGTRDDRSAEVFGPYISSRTAAPPGERISYTTDIPPGERRKAGDRHDGLTAVWYRRVARPGSGAVLERIVSVYEARPLTYQVGVTAEEMDARKVEQTGSDPSWLPSSN